MGNAFLLIIAGLLLFYVVISDKFYCLEGCITCLAGRYDSGGVGAAVSGSAGAVGIGVPKVPSVPTVKGGIGGVFQPK